MLVPEADLVQALMDLMGPDNDWVEGGPKEVDELDEVDSWPQLQLVQTR